MGNHPECCEKILGLLSDYLDFELPPGDCGEVERHLADCPACVEFLESLRDTIALCHEYAPSALPGPLSDRARRELEGAWRRMLAAREGPASK
jgi:anti-sigma factor RsiW